MSSPALTPDDHLILVDGSSYIFRAYHALPPLTRKSDGLPVGAVSGFCNMLWKLLQDAGNSPTEAPPTHLAVIFDASGVTFRNEIYTEYKAHRPEPPEDLRPQFGLIRDAVRAFNVPSIEQTGFEADDLIATYVRLARSAGASVTMVASDKDLMQLIGPGIVMVDTMKDRRIAVPEVHEKFGVAPEKVVDVQALAGDSVDNVPGVPGIGVKTAAQLITEFGDLDALLDQADTIKQKKRRENLIEFADLARVSRDLVRLRQDVPLEVPLEDLGVQALDGAKLIAFLKAMEFSTLTRRVAEATEADMAAIDASTVAVTGWEAPAGGGSATQSGAASGGDPADGPWAPNAVPESRLAEALAVPIDPATYETVHTLEALKAWIDEANDLGIVAVDTETTSLDAMQADLVGVSLATRPGRACYIPLQHREGADLLGGGLLPDQIPLKDALAALKPLLEDPSVLKIAQNLK
ncbi:MAG: 5'-3' exonuclease H3TH domain-containing protein, partial [Pseudomonadota bacterium]